jgi:hypothetical protein
MAVYATTTDLADDWLEIPEAQLPAMTGRALKRASELVDDHVRAAYATDPDTGLPTDTAVGDALKFATCAQVERWLVEATDEDDITGRPKDKQIGPLRLTLSLEQRAELAPRARRILHTAGLLSGAVADGATAGLPDGWWRAC